MSKRWDNQGTECGIMWLHQINTFEEIQEYQQCYDKNRKKIKQHGQRQEPGEYSPVKAALYYSGTTLLLQFVQMNPGHQLWDFFTSLVPVLINQENSIAEDGGKDEDEITDDFQGLERVYDFTVAHQLPACGDEIWICAILRKLGVFVRTNRDIDNGVNPTGNLRSDATRWNVKSRKLPAIKEEASTEENLIPTFNGVLTCFEKLVVPIPGWDHDNQRLDRLALGWVNQKVRQAFELDTLEGISSEVLFEKQLRILMYPHNTAGEAGKRRAWLDATKVYARLASSSTSSVNDAPEKFLFRSTEEGSPGFRRRMNTKVFDISTTLVTDFSKVSVEQQAELFYSHDVLIMSHGGQMGNVIFCRSNTLVIEVTCGGYSQIQQGGDIFAQSLNLLHVVYKPCGCEERRDEANYDLPVEEVFWIMETVLYDSTETMRRFRQNFGSMNLPSRHQNLFFC